MAGAPGGGDPGGAAAGGGGGVGNGGGTGAMEPSLRSLIAPGNDGQYVGGHGLMAAVAVGDAVSHQMGAPAAVASISAGQADPIEAGFAGMSSLHGIGSSFVQQPQGQQQAQHHQQQEQQAAQALVSGAGLGLQGGHGFAEDPAILTATSEDTGGEATGAAAAGAAAEYPPRKKVRCESSNGDGGSAHAAEAVGFEGDHAVGADSGMVREGDVRSSGLGTNAPAIGAGGGGDSGMAAVAGLSGGGGEAGNAGERGRIEPEACIGAPAVLPGFSWGAEGGNGRGGVEGSKNLTAQSQGVGSRYKGVCSSRGNQRFAAQIWDPDQYRPRHIGSFGSEEAAARAYDVEVLKLRGNKGQTNFPIEDYLPGGAYAGNLAGSEGGGENGGVSNQAVSGAGRGFCGAAGGGYVSDVGEASAAAGSSGIREMTEGELAQALLSLPATGLPTAAAGAGVEADAGGGGVGAADGDLYDVGNVGDAQQQASAMVLGDGLRGPDEELGAGQQQQGQAAYVGRRRSRKRSSSSGA